MFTAHEVVAGEFFVAHAVGREVISQWKAENKPHAYAIGEVAEDKVRGDGKRSKPCQSVRSRDRENT